jgi:FkbM family methyltransferase
MPRAFGHRPIYLSPDAALSCLRLRWARAFQGLFDIASRFVTTGCRVWDVGGNVGVFTFAAAHRAGAGGHVVVIEADPFLANLLQKTAALPANGDLNVDVLCAAAADREGVARFLVAARGRASSSLEQAGHRSQAGGTRYAQYVATVTLDGLLQHFPGPDLLKIDVEGAEAIVLAGAEQILARQRPVVYVEVGDEQAGAVTALLHRHGYALFDGDGRPDVEIDRCTFNTLAIPRESSLMRRP